MQLTDAFCYALLTITMAATCIQAENTQDDLEERKIGQRVSRRTETLLLNAAPVERMFQKPKVIYRRISTNRQPPSRGSYGPPRPKYGPPRAFTKPGKKYRSKASAKHAHAHQKKRPPKSRYGQPKRLSTRPSYRPPKSRPHRKYRQSNNSGFGEPPLRYSNDYLPPKNDGFPRPHFEYYDTPSNKPSNDFGNDFSSNPFEDGFSSKPNVGHEISSTASFTNDYTNKPFGDGFLNKPEFNDFQLNQKPGHGEPPVDSYGVPIKANLHDLTFSTAQSYPDAMSHVEEDYSLGSNPALWKNFEDQRPDSNFAYSKKVITFSKPDHEIHITPAPTSNEQNEEQHLNSYSDIYNFRQTKDKKKKKASYFENYKILNQPWKGNKMKTESNEEIIVGGQYAEPPARYFPRFQSSSSIQNNDDSEFSAPLNFQNNNAASSATTISSYVNYKNSNMAFSPQNLNDVFSIVD